MPRGGIADIGTIASAWPWPEGARNTSRFVAAMEALLDPKIAHDKAQATSGSTFPVVIVNAPIAKDIGLNSALVYLARPAVYPAGASITERFACFSKMSGALSPAGSMALFGAMRTTNAVFAENESDLPEGCRLQRRTRRDAGRSKRGYGAWQPAATSCRGVGKEELLQEVEEGLIRGCHLGVPNAHYPRSWSRGIPGTLLLPPVVAGQLAGQGYKSKAEVREKLWSLSKIAAEVVRESGMIQWIEQDDDPDARASASLDPWPIAKSPDQLVLTVAGGNHPTHSYWMQAWDRVTRAEVSQC